MGTLGGKSALALAINDSDQLAGYLTTSAGFDRAFLYETGVVTDLGTLGGDYSYALGINNSNTVVGGSFVDTNNVVYHAFLWGSNTMVDLNSQVDASGAGWTLLEARAINDPGQIVGVGTLGGARHAFLLTPHEATPTALEVFPSDGLSSSGPVGGPFSPSSIVYTLTNSGGSTLDWTAGQSQGWVGLSATNGSLVAGASTNITVSINANADVLAPGSYTDTVGFTNVTSGSGDTTRNVSLTVNTVGQLAVSPVGGLSSSGPEGGPFSPSSIV